MSKKNKFLIILPAVTLWLLTEACTVFGLTDSRKPDSSSCTDPQGSALNLGSRLELFVDDYLIDHLTGNAVIKLNHPQPKEIVIVHDEPWEGNGSGYRSIFFDGEKYCMYYKAWQMRIEPGKYIPEDTIQCCYAYSYDGIKWHKPELGLYEFNGSKANNIVFIKGVMGGVNADGGHPAVFKDDNPNAPADARYKAILAGAEEYCLFAFKSPDGIHWTPMSQKPIITDGSFDSQNLVFWDSEREEYRAYWRYFSKGTKENPYIGIRCIRTARSKDFVNWYDQQDLAYDKTQTGNLYTNVIKPYYRAPHIFIGFPERYIDRGWSESMRALPELKHRELRSSAKPRYGTALGEPLFMSSRDGVLFKCWDEAFIRPGIEREGTWYYGQYSIGWSIVETKSTLEGGAPNEISIYADESSWTGSSNALRRFTLRLDGFVSINSPMKGGELITKPLTFTGKNLYLNFSTSAAGDIYVEIQDETGKPIPGFTLEDCATIFGDTIERKVFWKSGSDLSTLEGKTVRLRFVLRDADLYSLRFK